jgi:hypothetical protein
MSKQDKKKFDVEALENSASILQRKEQKIEGTNLPGGPGTYYFHFFFFLHGIFKLIIN